MPTVPHQSRTLVPPPFRMALASALFLLAGATAWAHVGPPAGDPPPYQQSQRIDVNTLAMLVSNVGSFAWDLASFEPGLEYPRGSGKALAYAGGLWLAGKAGARIRTAIAEFGWDYAQGPMVGGTFQEDPVRFKVYKVSRADTAGWGEWVGRAAELGAPLDPTGTRPGMIGDQMLWTAFNDADSTPPFRVRQSPVPRTPIGAEVQLTAFGFDRPGGLGNAVFLRYRIIHKGTAPLDSAYVGLFLDPHPGLDATPAACDTSLDLGYAYRLDGSGVYGTAGPAVGLDLLRGPRDPAAGGPLRMRSFVAYPNGSDPADSLQFYDVLRGVFPWGAPMLDGTTGQPTPFYSWGDPVTGSGWVETAVPHPHMVLAAGPFTFAPGDTQEVNAALVVGHGPDRLASVAELRLVSREVQRLFDEGFASVSFPEQPAGDIEARPNPSDAQVRLVFRVPGTGAAVQVAAYDILGRRVRTLADGWEPPGSRRLDWDGRDDSGRQVPAGVYFARAVIGGRESWTRIIMLR